MHQNGRKIRAAALGAGLCAAMTTLAYASEAAAPVRQTCHMSVIYGITAVLSLLLLLAYCLFLHKKERWFLVLFVSVFITDLGYFLLSISGTLGEAMLANRIAYLGSVCLPLCMLMIIMGVCDLQPGKAVTGVLIGISALVFLLAASGGYLQLYYKDVTLEIVGGAAKLKKEYGPLHLVYFIYLFAYLAAMIGVIVYAAKKKRGQLRKYAPILCTVALLNMAIWFVEQQINWDFEFLAVSYIVSELLLLFLYDLLLDAQQPVAVSLADMEKSCPGLGELTAREMDVLRLMLENKKRREIADELFVTENTVKKHTAHIYEKLHVSDRSELLLKLGGTRFL